MFTNFATIVSVLATLAAVAPSANAFPSTGLAGRSVHRAVAAQFHEEKREYAEDADLLETYANYNERYELFGCVNKHNTTFFDSCCHPLLKDENEDALPDVCFEDLPCDSTTTSAHTSTSTHAAVTTKAAVVKTTTTHAPTTTTHEASTTKKDAAETTSSVSSTGGDWRTGGHSTFYYQEGNAGACGQKHSDSDLIVALDIDYYGDKNAVSSYCGKYVEIVNLNNGQSIKALIADVCPSCDSKNCLDMSWGTFSGLGGTKSEGVFPIKYQVLG